MNRRIIRALPAAFTALAIAVILLPVTGRPACACSMKHTSYRAAMMSDLRNLVSAQEAFLVESGRYGAVDELIAMGEYRFSAAVQLGESSVRDSSYTVHVRHSELPDMPCTVSVGADAPRDGEPVCGLFPNERAHIRNAIIYLALLVVVLALRLRYAVVGKHRFFSWRVLLLPPLAIVHPFWDVISARVIDHCHLGDFDVLWMGFAAATAGYLYLGPGSARPADGPPTAD